jgi:hypothetical protein
MIGWLMWNGMRVLAALGLLILGGGVVLLVWFMFEVGLAWIAIVVIAVVLLAAFYVLRRLYAGARPPREADS